MIYQNFQFMAVAAYCWDGLFRDKAVISLMAPTVAEAATDAAAAGGVLRVLENIVFPVPRRHINAYLPT